MEKYHTLTNSASYIKYSYALLPPLHQLLLNTGWKKMASKRGHKRHHCLSSPCAAVSVIKETNWLEKQQHYRESCGNSTPTAHGHGCFSDSTGNKEWNGSSFWMSKIHKNGTGADKLPVGRSSFASHSPVRDLLLYTGKIILKGIPSKAENCRSHLSSYSSKNSARDLKSWKLRHIKSCRH